MDLIQAFTNEQLKKEIPLVRIGDTVRVHNKIKEGSRERIQMFEGTVIAKHGGGISETFTVTREKKNIHRRKIFLRIIHPTVSLYYIITFIKIL